jgi:hypothetical protein
MVASVGPVQEGVRIDGRRFATGSLPVVRLPRYIAGPRSVIVLLVLAVTLCLGTLIYVQHANSLIIDQDMQTAVSLSEIAARFDHEDGSLYRLLVDTAANGRSASDGSRLIGIQHSIRQISADLSGQKSSLESTDRRRAAYVVAQLAQYDEAVGVVSSMLEVDFAASVAMLRPFRINADRVLREIKTIAASGIADARRHAEAAAWRTRFLVAFVTAAVLIVAGPMCGLRSLRNAACSCRQRSGGAAMPSRKHCSLPVPTL